MKLDIGAGEVQDDGWTTVDLFDPAAEVQAAAWELPFDSESIECARLIHVLEHLTPAEAAKTLGECHRVLEPGGHLAVEVPDFELLCQSFAWIDRAEPYRHQYGDGWRQAVMNAIHGSPDRPGMGHQWGYTMVTLSNVIMDAGFSVPTLQNLWSHGSDSILATTVKQ